MLYSKRFIDRLKPHLEITKEICIEVDIHLNEVQLYGRLTHIGKDGQFDYSVHTIWKNQLLEMWIRHLVLNVLRPSNVALTSRWLDDKKLYSFVPVESPEKHLGELLDLYWQGLHRPLHFFPKSSCEYMEHRLKDKDIEYCLN